MNSFSGQSPLAGALNELRGAVQSRTPSGAPGVLTNRTTRGVTRRPLRRTVQRPSGPFPVMFAGFLPPFQLLVCQTYQKNPDGIGILRNDDFYLVEPPPQFGDSIFHAVPASITDEELVAVYNRGSGLDLAPMLNDPSEEAFTNLPQNVVITRMKSGDPQGRILRFIHPNQWEHPFGPQKRQKRLTQRWWPPYTPGQSVLYITELRSGTGFSAPATTPPGSPWEGKTLKSGYLDMNIDARRWTNHRHVADAERVFFDSATIGVLGPDDQPVTVKNELTGETVGLRVNLPPRNLLVFDTPQAPLPP